MLLHEEGAEADKSGLELLIALQALEIIITNFDPEDIYSKDETGIFYCLLPRYILQGLEGRPNLM